MDEAACPEPTIDHDGVLSFLAPLGEWHSNGVIYGVIWCNDVFPCFPPV